MIRSSAYSLKLDVGRRGHARPSFGLRLDAAEPLLAQIPNAIGHPFNVLLDRWQHVGQH
jgi:hypothetical protein